MLIVKTYVAQSNIHGMGVFTAVPLKVGTEVWVFDPVIDREITPAHLAAFPNAAREVALARSFVTHDGRMILSRDNGVFLNHSEAISDLAVRAENLVIAG